jgi:hypothetical protein
MFAVLAVATSTAIVSFIFLVSLIKSKFSRISHIDIISLVVAVGVGVFWKVSNDAVIANIALQVLFVISFFPTINGLLKGVARERPVPWLLGTAAYIVQIVIVLSNPITLWAVTFPLIQIIGQGTIAFLAYRQSSSNNLVT